MCPYFISFILERKLDMKIGLYNLISEVHNEGYINSTLQGFIAEIEEKLGEKFDNINLEDFNQDYFPLIFIKSGGAEVKFKQIFQQIDGPYHLLLSSGLHNSLAASLEIASFLKQKGKRVEIIHGDSD